MRPTISINVVGEQMLVCHECESMFFSSDPNRKYCDQHLVERVNGAGIFEDDDEDELFQLHAHTCADCGTAFSTSRRSAHCALCASLRSGQVGAATVVCPACGVAHQVPVLAPSKLCGPCRLDPVLTLASARARFDAAREAWLAIDERLQADYAHADATLQARYDAAITLRTHGTLGDTSYSAAQVDAAWTKALAKGDDLAPLLALYDRAQAAALTQVQAGDAVRAVEEAGEG